MIVKRESFTLGKKKLGFVLHGDTGAKCLVLTRSRKSIFLEKNSRINHAIEEDVAGWSVEVSILSRMRMRKIPVLVIKVREDSEFFMARLQDFADHSHMRNKRIKMGSALRTLPFQFFKRRQGIVKL